MLYFGNKILLAGLLITIIAVFVPFSPGMPASSLDPSWQYGMNHALAMGLSIGQDIVFTFGPYASVFTTLYHPETYYLMLGGSFYLALSCCLAFTILINRGSYIWALIFCFILVCLVLSRDSLLLSLPLMIGLATYKINENSEKLWVTKYKLTSLYISIIFSSLGLLVLVKGSMLLLSIAVIAVSSILFLSRRKYLFFSICTTSPLISVILFWLISGQSINALPDYFINIIPIISGYTEAMASTSSGQYLQIIMYIISSIFLVGSIWLRKEFKNDVKLFLIVLFSLFLFLAFKGGFVRHDGHALLPASAILIAIVLSHITIRSPVNKLGWLAVFSAIICWGVIDIRYANSSTRSIIDRLQSKYGALYSGISNIEGKKTSLNIQYKQAINALKDQANFPVIEGATDIYSYNQSFLIASNMLWSPRPVFQSYFAYTPKLIEMNRQHLIGKNAPENIIFRVESIDGRIPAVEDGASWPEILVNYGPNKIRDGFIFLHEEENIKRPNNKITISTENHVFGETVPLPKVEKPLFIKLNIKKTLLGQLLSIIFKPEQLQISVELYNGQKKQFRIISGMAKTGLIISPLIESTEEFLRLYANNNLLNSKRVKSITISTKANKDSSWHWKSEYEVTFSELEDVPAIEGSSLFEFSKIESDLSNKEVDMAEKCEGSVDIINGRLVSEVPKHVISGVLEANGWMAVSVEQGVLPDDVYVVLTGEDTQRHFIRALSSSRQDVGAYFKKVKLNSSGYKVIADISNLKGQFGLQIAIKKDEKIELCPQFNIPVVITHE